ncbi:MAG: hypothetical protein LBQ42_13710 [Synergistaceae bacterium]|nr:hypothetical protein [Synergistaceae bacterium]
MPGTNDFKPFAVDPQAHLVSQDVWAGPTLRPQGHIQGSIANSALANKALRQATTMAAVLGELIASQQGDAIDNGDLATLLLQLQTSLARIISLTGGLPQGGMIGQIPVKVGPDDFDVAWQDTSRSSPPSGGLTGQVLAKASMADYDYIWQSAGGSDIDVIQKDIVSLYETVGNIIMSLEALELYPDYSNMLVEDFKDRITLDRFSASVSQATSGTTFLVISPTAGIIPNTNYHISDNLNEEDVIIIGINNTNGNYRLALAAPLIHSYQTPGALLTRMDAQVQDGQVAGPSRDMTATWNPSITWRGTIADAAYDVAPVVTVDNTQNYSTVGDIAIGANGLVTLGVK